MRFSLYRDHVVHHNYTMYFVVPLTFPVIAGFPDASRQYAWIRQHTVACYRLAKTTPVSMRVYIVSATMLTMLVRT